MVKKFDASVLKKRLARFPDVVRREVSASIEKNALEWVATSKAMAPKDKGALVASIRHAATPTGGQIVEAGGQTTYRAVRSGTSVALDYAEEQEFGNEQTPPSPFFWSAYRLLKRKFKSRNSRAMSKAFKELSDV